jgi:hypothetical protein
MCKVIYVTRVGPYVSDVSSGGNSECSVSGLYELLRGMCEVDEE